MGTVLPTARDSSSTSGTGHMMTSRRFVSVIETCYPSLEVPYVLPRKLSHRPRNAVFSLAEIVACDSAQYEPSRFDGTFECAGDLRFPNSWVIADRHFDDPETLLGSLQD